MLLISFLKGAWNGEERLWKVFWLGGIAFYIFAALVEISFSSKGLPLFILIFEVSLLLLFRIVFWYCVWRCSKNSHHVWKGVTRLCIASAVFWEAVLLLRGESCFHKLLQLF